MSVAAINIINTIGAKIMAMKPRPKMKGIPIGSFDEVKDAAGKTLIKPKLKRKAASEHIRQRKSKKVSVRRRTV